MLSNPCLKTRGQTALIGVLIIATVILVIAISLGFSGTQELLLSAEATANKKALDLADSCAEEALLQVQKQDNYAGGNFDLFGGSCQITVDKPTAARKKINITARLDNHTRKIEIELVATPKEEFKGEGKAKGRNKIKIESWRELTN